MKEPLLFFHTTILFKGLFKYLVSFPIPKQRDKAVYKAFLLLSLKQPCEVGEAKH